MGFCLGLRRALGWLAFGVLIFTCRAAAGEDWNRFRGPQGDGVSRQEGLLRQWPAEGPRELWRRPLGAGYSAISVAGDLLYTSFADGESEYAGAFRVADGSEVWRQRLDALFADEWGNGPRATPTVDGDRVYALSALGKLYALGAADGRVLWQVDYARRFGPAVDLYSLAGAVPPEAAQSPEFGHSSSPLVEGDLVIVYPGSMAPPAAEAATPAHVLAALDKRTGETVWTAVAGLSGHSTPVAWDLAGRRQIVQILPREIVGVSPAGEVLWRHPWGDVTVSQPVLLGGDRVFASTVNDHGAEVFAVRATAEGFTTETVWKSRHMRNSWPSTVFHDGAFYGFDNATLRCLDAATGELRWAHRGLGKGTVVIADGLLLVLGDQGVLTLAEATPEGYRETGRVKVFADGPTWTVPTPAGGRLFLRNHKEMVALSLTGPAEAPAEEVAP